MVHTAILCILRKLALMIIFSMIDLMTFEIKVHIVPHLKANDVGYETSSSTFI